MSIRRCAVSCSRSMLPRALDPAINSRLHALTPNHKLSSTGAVYTITSTVLCTNCSHCSLQHCHRTAIAQPLHSSISWPARDEATLQPPHCSPLTAAPPCSFQKFPGSDYQAYIHTSKYAKWIDSSGRRECWNETVGRCAAARRPPATPTGHAVSARVPACRVSSGIAHSMQSTQHASITRVSPF